MKFLGVGAAAAVPVVAIAARPEPVHPGITSNGLDYEPHDSLFPIDNITPTLSLREHTTYDSYDGPINRVTATEITAHQRQLGKSMAQIVDDQLIDAWRKQLIRDAQRDSKFLKMIR